MNKISLFIAVLTSIIFIYGVTFEKPVKESKEEWIDMFNGENLDGWDIKIAGFPMNDNHKNTFRVEDGMLRISYDDYDLFNNHFGHLYYHKSYSHYKMSLDYRFIGTKVEDAPSYVDRNSGVMFHSQSAESVELGQSFPVSLEMQLLAGLGTGERPTANICTPGTLVHIDGELREEHCINSTSKTYEGEGWVNAVLEVYGDSLIRHIIEGDTVLTYHNPLIGGGFVSPQFDWTAAHISNSKIWTDKDNQPLTSGYIALQAEGQAIDFKNIKLLVIKE